MNKERQRKLDARANREASRASRYGTTIQVPPPKDMVSRSAVKVAPKVEPKAVAAKIPAKKSPVVASTKKPLAEVKRGRGRPPKALAKQNQVGKKKITTTGAKKEKRK